MERSILTDELIKAKDEKYGDLTAKLTPDVPRELIIGVRSPVLRDLAKKYAGTPDAESFITALPHAFHDENNLHAMLLNREKDPARCLDRIEAFLPYVNNWQTCDTLIPACLKKALPELLCRIRVWIGSELTYTVRFAIKMLMTFFLDGNFRPEYPAAVAAVRSDEYYVKMMAAWYFATALAKNYDGVIGFLEDGRLDPWTHNKTISKANDSFRITKEQKEYLKSLRIK